MAEDNDALLRIAEAIADHFAPMRERRAELAADPAAVEEVLREGAVRAHMAFLADDLVEGRGTGQRGGELAVRYLEAHLQALGLQPGNGGSFRQTVQLAGVRIEPGKSRLSFTGAAGVVTPPILKPARLSSDWK